MRPILILLHGLGSGGVTTAVLDQARMFREAGREVQIITFEDDPDPASKTERLRAAGRLDPGVRVRNIYQEHREAAEQGRDRSLRSVPSTALRLARRGADRIRSRLDDLRDPGLTEAGSDKRGQYRRRFSSAGQYLAFERLNDDGTMKHTDFFENRALTRKDQYGGGAVTRRTWFAAKNAENRVEFLTADGFCFAQRWIDPETGRGVGVYVADRPRRTVTRYNGLPDWHVSWLQRLVDEFPTAPLVVAETASVIPKLLRLRRESAVRLAMMHNSQVAAPFAVDSPLRPDYEATFSRLGELDGYIVLSEQQRADMAERLGHEDLFMVVPNAVRIPESTPSERDPHLVSVVSRLAPQKALHEAIHAFGDVVKHVPQARLEIYGGGSERRNLEDLVTRADLAEHVLFKGRTSDPLGVMGRSVCTVSTSDWEALPLSIAESLAIGTPVVAYDCLYGPAALIRNGESGYVVPKGDREAFAAAVVELLENPARADVMGARGRQDMKDRLAFTPVLQDWERAFAHAEKRSGLPQG